MIRRLFRIAAAAVCLLSLLACVGLSCVWWLTARPGAGPRRVLTADVALFGTDVEVYAGAGGLQVSAIRHWPGPAGVWGRHYDGPSFKTFDGPPGRPGQWV